MAEADYFYVTLPSNSSLASFPGNKTYHFTTKLNKPIHLAGEWEVGLAEISYPQAWYNVRAHEMTWRVLKEQDVHEGLDPLVSATYHLSPGIYRKPHIVIQQMQEEMSRGHITIDPDQDLVFSINEATHKATLKIGKYHRIWFNSSLARLLGMSSRYTDVLLPEGEYVGDKMVDLSQDLHSMYVYCDLIAPQIVGDAHAPLLRTIPLEYRTDAPEALSKVFNHIYFMPLLKKEISTIEIDIRDDIGRSVSFERGRLVVTLVFKRKSGFHW